MPSFSRPILVLPLLLFSLLMIPETPRAAERPTPSNGAPNWVRVTEHADWKPRDSSGEVVFKNRLWILGGWFDSFSEPPRDVWSSADGAKWDLVTEKAPWKHSDLPTTLVFKDRMWMMGGWHNGRLPDATASNEVWTSRDGADWEQVTGNAGWSPRLGAAGVVFRGKMWVVGGVERYYDGTERHLKNDVWTSSNGKSWQQVTANAPWAPRAYHGALAHNGYLWVFGGGNYVPKYAAFNDVWRSRDGVNWTQVRAHAPWEPRIWFSAAVYRNRMWLLGGWSNHPFRNWNDVWHSEDGEQWERLVTKDVWSVRHEHSTYVWKDRLWVTAGNVSPLVNDVWRLELPRGWPGK